jgi:ligand-binding SRPBCC domain-containing protein
MPLIQLTTEINAPIQEVFDLARDIGFHQKSASKTKERAIAGRTSGLIELYETVTWEAVHFGIKQQLTTRITAMNAPHSFKDVMEKGTFKSMKHDHVFIEKDGVTSMIDLFRFESPYGLIGECFNALVLTKYMTRFLLDRNKAIKEIAERGR